MSLEQKQAWFILGAFALALLCFLTLIPLVGVQIAQGGFGVIGLGGLAPLLFRKKADPAEVSCDERDRAIARKATLAGAMAAYLVIFVAWGITKAICRHEDKQVIDIDILGTLLMCQFMVLFVVRSITLLVLYGRGAAHGQD